MKRLSMLCALTCFSVYRAIAGDQIFEYDSDNISDFNDPKGAWVLGIRVTAFYWYGTPQQLERMNTKDTFLHFGCQRLVDQGDAKREATTAEIGSLPSIPVIFLDHADFKRVLEKAKTLRVRTTTPYSLSNPSNNRNPLGGGGNGGGPSNSGVLPSPTPSPRESVASPPPPPDSGEWDGEICINKDGVSFSVTHNGIGFEISTKGSVGVVVGDEDGKVTLDLSPRKSDSE